MQYVVKPEAVVECGNHNIWLYRFGKRQHKVNATLGLSQHYRICEFGGVSCTNKPNVSDERAQVWGPQLFLAVHQLCHKIFGHKGCPATPQPGSPF